MMQLIQLFQEASFNIKFASTASVSEKSAPLKRLGISSEILKLNDSSFDEFIITINPEIVIFDRYITEEQFGWRVSDNCPNAVKILDTEDLHFLRKARQEAFKKTGDITKANLYSETAKRELASILRCDCSLIISQFEIKLLTETFKIPKSFFWYLPLLIDEISEENIDRFTPFEDRLGFMTIGNLLHAPNVDAVLYLKKSIWPLIKAKLPNATISIFGNYAPQQIKELHNVKDGFLIKGWAESVIEVMSQARVCLAPLRYGAGIKGKIIDAVKNGTPVVTTPIGAEGIFDINTYPAVEDDALSFASAAIDLHEQKKNWLLAQQAGVKICNTKFKKSCFSEAFIAHIKELHVNLSKHRNEHFISQILQHQQLNTTKYMSKWIEEKNK
ncbi:glycosyl transferase [Patiriisocius marinistellae]|uniref:Glycosyl transferase n=2 Tax=Patiriisocius marinistellae TaxID=2494560 RepID=A0A5J4FV78_9FLAO|nr:glycosyl transferase [Patiriisocius marinistellae]